MIMRRMLVVLSLLSMVSRSMEEDASAFQGYELQPVTDLAMAPNLVKTYTIPAQVTAIPSTLPALPSALPQGRSRPTPQGGGGS